MLFMFFPLFIFLLSLLISFYSSTVDSQEVFSIIVQWSQKFQSLFLDSAQWALAATNSYFMSNKFHY